MIDPEHCDVPMFHSAGARLLVVLAREKWEVHDRVKIDDPYSASRPVWAQRVMKYG